MITCYYCKSKHELVAQVKACAANSNSKIAEAFAAKVETGTIVETVIPATVKKVSIPAHRMDAKYLALKAKVQPKDDVIVPFTPAEVQVFASSPAVEVKKGQDLELGMYQVTDVNGIKTIYKIKWNKTNTYKYAERLVITDGKWTKTGKPSGKFIYAGSMMNKLTSENKMTAEQAKAFHDSTKEKYGQTYGFCCVCGKLLTVKKSVDAGIGPVCAGKL